MTSLSILEFARISVWGKPFTIGFLIHTVLLIATFSIVTNTMKMPNSEVMVATTFCAWMPIAFLDFPINIWVLERYDIGFWNGFLLLTLLGGIMWGMIIALIAIGMRAFRTRKPL